MLYFATTGCGWCVSSQLSVSKAGIRSEAEDGHRWPDQFDLKTWVALHYVIVIAGRSTGSYDVFWLISQRVRTSSATGVFIQVLTITEAGIEITVKTFK